MIEWGILVLLTAVGGALLVRPECFGPLDGLPGSTLLGFLLLALGMTSPIILHPSHAMLDAGAGSDAFIGAWNLWWVRNSLEQGLNPFFTDRLFAPHGTSLALHTHAVTYGVLSLPAQWILGNDRLLVVYNLIVLFSFTFTGYFTYRIALSQSQDRSGALLAGVIFAYSNFRFANTVRLHVLATEWLVLFVWAGAVLIARPTPRRLLLWLGSGIALLHASLEYTAYAALLLVLLGIAEGLKRKPLLADIKRWLESGHRRCHSLRSWLAVGISGVVVGLGLLWPFLSQFIYRQREGATEFKARSVAHFSADLLDFVIPNPRHPLWGSSFEAITAGFHRGDGGFGLSVGWVALGLFGWAALVLFRARHGRRWVLACLFFVVLSLGPILHVAGRAIEILPMPQAILADALPFLASSRTPIRYMAPAFLCLAVAIAMAWAKRDQMRPPTGRFGQMSGVGVLLGTLILFESLSAPMTLTPLRIPDVYSHLRTRTAEPSEYDPKSRSHTRDALIHLPPVNARENLLFQTVHELPLVEDVGSAVPFRSPSATTLLRSPGLRMLYQLSRLDVFSGMTAVQRDEKSQEIEHFLKENGIRWVVVRPTRPRNESVRQAYLGSLRSLSPDGEQEIGDYTVFRFDPDPAGRDDIE